MKDLHDKQYYVGIVLSKQLSTDQISWFAKKNPKIKIKTIVPKAGQSWSQVGFQEDDEQNLNLRIYQSCALISNAPSTVKCIVSHIIVATYRPIVDQLNLYIDYSNVKRLCDLKIPLTFDCYFLGRNSSTHSLGTSIDSVCDSYSIHSSYTSTTRRTKHPHLVKLRIHQFLQDLLLNTKKVESIKQELKIQGELIDSYNFNEVFDVDIFSKMISLNLNLHLVLYSNQQLPKDTN
jgi:hypothetical protein